MDPFGMELNRRVRDRTFSILLVLGNIVTITALHGVHQKTGSSLDCTNDFDSLMFCDFEAQNCSEYNLTLLNNDGHGESYCTLKQCDRVGQCCCSVEIIPIPGETYTAGIWKEGQRIETKTISISESIKPRPPVIISVDEVNGNFAVKWKTTYSERYFSSTLTANVTYYKKGHTEKVSKSVTPATLDGENIYEISGEDLEPSTTYVVSVRSYSDWSGKFSDSSNEWEFTVPASSIPLLLAIIIGLSIAGALISGAIFGCYVKLRAMWWDTVKCTDPNPLTLRPQHEKLLEPEKLKTYTVCVEPCISDDPKSESDKSETDSSEDEEESSGISTGSSFLGYANTGPPDVQASVHDALCKLFPNISPGSALPTNLLTGSNKDRGLISSPYSPSGVTANDTSSGSSNFDNKTYSIQILSCSHQMTMDSSDVQTQAEMVCESAYHPSDRDTVTCPDQQGPAFLALNFPPAASSLMPTEMSYQQRSADSGRFSYAEDSSLSSISSSTNTTASCDPVSRVEAGCESFYEEVSGAAKLNGEREEATVCDENPCYGCAPAGPHSCAPVDDDYQAFQNLVERPGVLLSEQTSGEKEKYLDNYPEGSLTKIPPMIPGLINNFQGGQCLSDLQNPLFPLISADQRMPVITVSGYQSV